MEAAAVHWEGGCLTVQATFGSRGTERVCGIPRWVSGHRPLTAMQAARQGGREDGAEGQFA